MVQFLDHEKSINTDELWPIWIIQVFNTFLLFLYSANLHPKFDPPKSVLFMAINKVSFG